MISSGSIEDIHSELGYSEADQVEIKKVKLVWQRLEDLRKKAQRDSSHLRSYHDLLSKSIAQARKSQVCADIEGDSQQFWLWYQAECEAKGVPAKEQVRGLPHQAWCEKWIPNKYAAFVFAYEKVIELPSPYHFQEAKKAAADMLQAYIEAI